jgi:hypothetical protein
VNGRPALSAVYGQRAAGLAAAALLAGVFGVALSDTRAGTDVGGTLPKPAVGSWGGWSTAHAGVAAVPPAGGRASVCGWLLRSLGVLHPTLPCGAQLFLEYGGVQALTRVVGRGPVPQGRQFDLTPALAKRLHVRGVREIRWAYAR